MTTRKIVLASMFTGGLLCSFAPLLLPSPRAWQVAMVTALVVIPFLLIAVAAEARVRHDPVGWAATFGRCSWSLIVSLGTAGVCAVPIVSSGMLSLPSHGQLFALLLPFGLLFSIIPFWGARQFDHLDAALQHRAAA